MAVTEEQRQTIRSLLNDGLTPDEIASRVGLRSAQVRAIKAHVTMGSYAGDGSSAGEAESEIVDAFETPLGEGFEKKLLPNGCVIYGTGEEEQEL